MKINRTLLHVPLFLIILFVSLEGCSFTPSEEDAIEVEMEEDKEKPEGETINEKEAEDMEYYVITESKYFEMPDEIILYNKGEQITVKKNTETYNKIVYITNERFKNDSEIAEEAISDEFIDDIKSNKFAIEFIYNKEIKTVYSCYEYRYEKNYTKILFPLPDWRAIFGPNQSGYHQEYQDGPLYVSIQPESDYLIEIIEKEFNRQ
ncbi:MAG: hypothetical protein PHG41_06900 [Actinomycetota bacterium]|nr:hypothetical protein [Actinomycetota bacterium]